MVICWQFQRCFNKDKHKVTLSESCQSFFTFNKWAGLILYKLFLKKSFETRKCSLHIFLYSKQMCYQSETNRTMWTEPIIGSVCMMLLLKYRFLFRWRTYKSQKSNMEIVNWKSLLLHFFQPTEILFCGPSELKYHCIHQVLQMAIVKNIDVMQ